MNEANVRNELTGSVEEFWSRLAPLTVLVYQAVVLACLVAAGFFAFAWFQQPMVGLMVDPEMIVGNVQQTVWLSRPGLILRPSSSRGC